MEKGFNDDELADIMNEIESLEKEFTEEVENKKEASSNSQQEEVESPANEEHIEPEMEESSEQEEAHSEHTEVAASHSENDSFEEDDFDDEDFDNEPVLEADPLEAHAEQAQVHHQVNEEENVVPINKEEEATLEKVVEKPMEEVVAPSASHNKHEDVVALSTKHDDSSAHTSMNFNVEGDMKLSLAFNISGKVVNLKVNDQGLQIDLEGGMKFSIPLENADQSKKAA